MANRLYEVLIAFDLGISLPDAEALLAKVSSIVAESKGSLKAVEKLGQRRLAFRVHGRTDAQFVLVTCELPATAVKTVENVLRLHEGVLRYMTTRLDPSLFVAAEAAAAQPGAAA